MNAQQIPADSVLVIRNSSRDRKSSANRIRNGQQVTETPFVWPESGPVACDDWDPSPERTCGGGLHGLLWGDGNWSLLSNADDAIWQVIQVPLGTITQMDSHGEWQATDNIVRSGDKCRFHKGEVIYSGKMADAVTMVLANRWHIEKTVQEISAQAEKGTAASSGNSSTAASSGDYSKAASSGNSSTAASSGNSSTAAAKGKNTIAMAAGNGCVVSAGENGCFASAYWDYKEDRYRILAAHVGENGIKPDTNYVIRDGKFVEV